MKNILETNALLAEFLQSVDASLLPHHESEKVTVLFEALYPLTRWGKIEWESIEIKKEIDNKEEIMFTLPKMLSASIDQSVYILCDDAMLPIIKTNLKDIIIHFCEMDCISMYKFIFNPMQGYIIEVLPSGITMGLIEKERIRLSGYLKDFLDGLPKEKFHNRYNEYEMRMVRKLLNPFTQPQYWSLSNPRFIESMLNIIPSIEALLKQSITEDVLILWEDKQFPLVETKLRGITSLWDILVKIKIPFQIIATNGTYLISFDAESDAVSLVVNFGLRLR